MRFIPVLSVALLAACSSKKTHKADDKAAAAKAPDGPQLTLFQDGQKLKTVPITHETALSELVPTTPRWLAVEGRSPDGRDVELAAPDNSPRDAEIRLDVKDGRITIGAYPKPATGVSPEVARLSALPSPFLAGVTEVEVFTHPVAQAAEATGLQIERPGHPAETLAEDDLARLEEKRPKPRVHGWALVDVVALAVHGDVARVDVVGKDGSHAFTHEQLADTSATIVLKHNQRGEYVLQVWGSTDTAPQLQVRGVTKLIVTSK
jgi:hypothetical protein